MAQGGQGGVGGNGSGGAGGAGGAGGQGGQGQGGQGGQGPLGCNDASGLSPQQLLGPIDTIVVLMLENRSFDHYFGGSLGIAEMRMDIDGVTGMEALPHPQGGTASPYAMSNLTPSSPPHSWTRCTRNGTTAPTTASSPKTPALRCPKK